jgi:hypothetical protein
MAFKMKGHTLPGIKQRKSESSSDGKATSSPYQKRSDRLEKRVLKKHSQMMDATMKGNKKKADRLFDKRNKLMEKEFEAENKEWAKKNKKADSSPNKKADSSPYQKAEDPRDNMEPTTEKAKRVKKRLLKKKGGNTAAVTRRINEGNIKGAKLQSRRARAKSKARRDKLDRKTDIADQKHWESLSPQERKEANERRAAAKKA